MRKGTKKIRKVNTGTREYYVYDLDEDAAGKRKRLYASSEAELKEKIRQAEEEKQLVLSYRKPETPTLENYVKFYFKNAVGNIPSANIKRSLQMFQTIVFPSEINKDIAQITVKDIEQFYKGLVEKYSAQSIDQIHEYLGKTFELSNALGVTDFDISKVSVPTRGKGELISEHIMNPDELKIMTDYCVEDDCKRYGRSELVITFSLLTGLKISEIQRLTIKDIAEDFSSLSLPKREFPLSEKVAVWLKAHLDSKDPLRTLKLEGAETMFCNSNGKPTALSSVQVTITRITQRLGLPRGITGKTIHKAVIVKRMNEGEGKEELRKLYGYKSSDPVQKMQDDFYILNELF